MRRARPDAIVSIRRGIAVITGGNYEVRLREPFWLIKLNQGMLLPGLRRDSRKLIYLNGKRSGYGVCKHGAIPIRCKRNHEEFFSDHLENLLAETLGICCHGRKRGYYEIKVQGVVFVVDVHRTEKCDYHCMLYTKHNDDYIGDFVFNTTFTTVYTRLGVDRYRKLFCIVIGYTMDALAHTVLSRPSMHLEINC